MRTEYEDLDKERRQAVDFLQKNRTEEALWECVIVYQRYPFHTVSGLPFQYELKHGRDGTLNKELMIDRREGSKALPGVPFAELFRMCLRRESSPLFNVRKRWETYGESAICILCFIGLASYRCRKNSKRS